MRKDGWLRVTKQNRCPVCEHPDWCMIGERFVLCNRVQSPMAKPGGGWLHPLDSQPKPVTKPKPVPPPPVIHAAKLIAGWASATPQGYLESLAAGLGVSIPSLAALNASWASSYRAWAFPMRDGYGEPIGIRLRADDGRKWAVRGSRAGLFIPQIAPQPVAYVTEGPTDTAAALTLGLFAIGRPSCNSGGLELRAACKRLGVREVVMVADDDKPGLEGAKSVAGQIRLPYRIWVPPCKDIREFLNAGGTAALIQSDLKNIVRRA